MQVEIVIEGGFGGRGRGELCVLPVGVHRVCFVLDGVDGKQVAVQMSTSQADLFAASLLQMSKHQG